MPYRRTKERGFRKLAMAFWKPSQDGKIHGHAQSDVTVTRRFQAHVEREFGVRPSMGQLVGRGVAIALTETPEINSKVIWGQAYVKDTVDIYFQVDLGDGKDLSGVVVPDVGAMTIVDLAKHLRALAEKLRKGRDMQYEKAQKGCLTRIPSFVLRPLLHFLTFCEYNLGLTPTLLGARPEPFGTVMISNVSTFGIDVAYAPLIPVARVPFVVLLGRVEPRPWVVADGSIQARPVVTMNATFDHRMVDGNKIGRVVRRVRDYIMNPYTYETELGLDPKDAPEVEPVPITDAVPEFWTDAPAPAPTADSDAAQDDAS